MKVSRVWQCECGGVTLLRPKVKGDRRLIVKGEAFLQVEAVSHAHTIITHCCSDKYEVLGPVVKLNVAKRLWKCGCGNSEAIRNSEGAILLKGDAFAYGYPTTHARCSNCDEMRRVAFDIVWASHLAVKDQKRANTKANRRARRRRQSS